MNRNPFIYLEVAAFLIFLSLGYWVGTSLPIEKPVRVHTNHLKPTPSPIPALPDGERILLLAGVDKLDNPEPQLRSLWLVTYYLKDQPIQLLPIYPTNASTQHPNESLIIDSFAVVTENGVAQLSPQFLNRLSENNYWLSGYILMDDHATSMLIDLIGGLPAYSGQLSGDQILSTMPPISENLQKALDQQTLLLGQYCLTISRLTKPPRWSTILELIPEHLVSDINPTWLLSEIQWITSGQIQLRCEFPALSYLP